MEEWMQLQNPAEDKSIEIIIHCIENVIIKEDMNVYFMIEHSGIILGESSPTLIRSGIGGELSIYRIDFTVNLPLVQNRESLDSIVSVPVLIKAIQTECDLDERSTVSTIEIKKKSIFSTNSISLPTSLPLGMCNLDLMPLILGEESFTEKLILETPVFSFDGASVSWQNLPRLTVTASQNNPPLLDPSEIANFLSITVESIYNLPQTFAENLIYVAGTIAYIDDEIPAHIIFEDGAWTKYRDVERTKRWNTLRHIENRARLSKYKLDCDFKGVKTDHKNQFDLKKKSCDDAARVEWNSMNRCIIWEKGVEAMRNHINKHRYWPFQIQISDKAAQQTKVKGATPMSLVYQCYVDVSELLFPGRRSCRVVGQLYEFNPTDITKTVGLQDNIFVMDTQQKEPKEKKSRSSKHAYSTVSEGEAVSTAIVAENEEPTVIVLEIELFEPLVACTVEEDCSNLIQEILPKLQRKPAHVYSSDVAEAQYKNCIQKLAEALTESYRDFCEESKTDNSKEKSREEKFCFDPDSDEMTCFVQYLYKTGAYLTVRNSLKMKIPMLIDQKFELPKNLVDSHETHNFISSVYTYLVEQMHTAVNSMVEGRQTQELVPQVDAKALYFYAEEAYELGDLDVAKQHYTKVITSNKTDPLPWTKYAIFLKSIGDVERAKECCIEAIMLDRQYATALLLYGVILFEDKQYRDAEIFFRTITNLYPRFFEGWAILHLFYIRTEYYPGIDFTYRVAVKCMQDENATVTFEQEPLSWTTVHCPKDSLYMMAAAYLLKLKFCEFAAIALAEEMTSTDDRSTHILYYTAVEHYLSGRYEDALSHLCKAKSDYGMDFSIGSLMGHCYFKMGHTERGVECYEFSRMLFDRPNDMHLVEVRLGYHYYNTGDFERARKIFLNVCNTSQTSLTWLGVGISCYELSQFYDAELSLLEANRIDNHNPEVWGYLCLLNMTLERYDEFSQCYGEMLKNNLKNRKLWLRITNLMEALDYAPPNLTGPKVLAEDYSTEESEERFQSEWHLDTKQMESGEQQTDCDGTHHIFQRSK